MRLELKTAPAGNPITLAQIKEMTFTNTDKYDNNMTALIPAVTDFVEKYTQLRLIDQSWYIYYSLPEFENVMKLSTLNCSAITEILYYDYENTSAVMDISYYRLSGDNELIFNDNLTFSSVSYRKFDTIRVEVVAGFGATESSVPYLIKSAMAEIVNQWVMETKTSKDSKPSMIPLSAKAKLDQYRRSNHWL